MTWVDQQEHYQEIARGFWPGATLTTNRVLSAFTGGRPFALGPLQIYRPEKSSLSFTTMAHESGHNATYEALGWVVPVAGWFFGKRVRAWCGVPFFLFLYFVAPFWVGFAPFRSWFELIAEKRRWRYMKAKGSAPSEIRAQAIKFGTTVNKSKAYGWALLWPGLWWYKRAAEGVIRESIS